MKTHFSLETKHDVVTFFNALSFYADNAESAKAFAEATAAHFNTALILVDPARAPEGKLRTVIEVDPSLKSAARALRITPDHGADA